jgi:GT2 family glycosyltransferase
MIGIITVLHNQKRFLKDFIDSLLIQTFNDFTLYLIDNNSKDDPFELTKELNKNNLIHIKYFSLDDNTGFAAGSNYGAKKAIDDGCEYLFILNPDVVLEINCVNALYQLIDKNKNIQCVGPLIMRNKNSNPDIIQELGGKIFFKKGTYKKYYTGKNIKETDLPGEMETEFVSGGACMIRSQEFKQAGMFEEKYFAYFDEIDLFYRLKKMFDLKMLVTTKAILWHNHDWTRNNPESYYFEFYLTERNKLLFFWKNKFYFSIIRCFTSELVKFPWRLLWFMKVCNFTLGIYYLRGLFAGLFNRSGKPKLSFMN